MARDAAPTDQADTIDVQTHGCGWEVLLDGEPVKHAYAANTADGWVDRFVPHPEHGGPFVAWERLTGRVEVRRVAGLDHFAIAPEAERALAPKPVAPRSVQFAALMGCAAALCLAIWALSTLAGCAVGYPLNPDGTPDLSAPVIGPSVGVGDAAKVGGLATLLTGNPTIGAGVTGLVGLIAAGWARSAGRHKGWEERETAATVQAPLKQEPA